jgi:hypothetical protein
MTSTQEVVLGSAPTLAPLELMTFAAACTERLRLQRSAEQLSLPFCSVAHPERKQTLMVAIPQEFADLLHTATLAHVATIGPKGEPQNTPVWFDWDGNHIRFSQTKARQKFRKVLSLDTVDNSINLYKHASGWFFRYWTVWTGHLILE